MHAILRQSTTVTVKIGPFLDSSDGITPETALVIQKADVRLSKNGGNYVTANANQGAADVGAPHDESGEYDITLNTTDTNTVGVLKLLVMETGALAVWDTFQILEEVAYDAIFAAGTLGNLGANVKQVNSVTIDGIGTTGDPWGPV